MLYTFAFVLIFSMLKELVEDCTWMKGDRQVNNAKTYVLNHSTGQFEIVKWKKLKPGDVVKIEKD